MSSAHCPISLALNSSSTISSEQTESLNLEVYNGIDAVPQTTWREVTRDDELFLSIEYLQAFEASVSENVDFKYVVLRNNNTCIGIASFQIIRFDAKNIKNDTSRIQTILAKSISKMSFKVLMCGNAFMTGEYGCWFGQRLNTTEELTYLKLAIEKVKEEEKQQGGKVDVLLLKDLFQDQEEAWDTFSNEAGFMKFQVQPNMTFLVNKEWGNFDGYLQAMTSKYRTRVKRALKDFKGVSVRTLSIEEVKNNMPLIEDLYHQVIGQSSFKLATFDIKHLVPMYEKLGEKFEVSGYFLKDELIAFTSSYKSSDNEMVAGMLGLRKDLQRKYDLYFNMLIHIVKQGIEGDYSKIIMGRTAMEIKSSLGAEPEDMTLYIKHTNKVINAIAKPIMKSLIQNEEWVQRHPFK